MNKFIKKENKIKTETETEIKNWLKKLLAAYNITYRYIHIKFPRFSNIKVL